MKARKKLVVIETVISLGFCGKDRNFSERPKWLERTTHVDKKIELFDAPEKLTTHTIEGPIYVIPGDYIIKGVNGELYLCKSDILEKTYEITEQSLTNVRPSILPSYCLQALRRKLLRLIGVTYQIYRVAT